MAEAFAFPHKLPEMKLGLYNDYINDLMWIEQKEIVLIINNYDLMLVDNLKLKNDIMADCEVLFQSKSKLACLKRCRKIVIIWRVLSPDTSFMGKHFS